MSDPSRDTLLTFPCAFPIKVIGARNEAFENEVLSIVGRHVSGVESLAVSRRESGGGRYLALTVTVTATSQGQLDAIYRELSAAPDVIMAL